MAVRRNRIVGAIRHWRERVVARDGGDHEHQHECERGGCQQAVIRTQQMRRSRRQRAGHELGIHQRAEPIGRQQLQDERELGAVMDVRQHDGAAGARRMDADRAGGCDALIPRLLEPHGRDVVEGDFLDYPVALPGDEAQIGQRVRAAGMKHEERESRRGRPENPFPRLHVANLRQTAQNLNAPRGAGYTAYRNATSA